MKALLSLAIVTGALIVATRTDAQPLQYPSTPRHPVVDTYHGIDVTDDYRWLEVDSSPAVRAWIEEQNQFARRYLDAIPQRAQIARRIAELELERTVQRFGFELRGGKLFALKMMPPANQPMLVVLPADGDTSKERVVLDPVALDSRGRTTIDFFKASFDGKYVFVSLSQDGSEDGTGYVYEVATGRKLDDVLPGVSYPTAGGSAEWAADSKGFYYTRYPRMGERAESDRYFYQQVYFHTLRSPIGADRYVIGRDFPRIAEIALFAGRDGRHLLAEVRNGDGGDIAFHLRDPSGRWVRVADFADGMKQAAIGESGHLFAMTVKDAPLGRILSMPLSKPELARARVVVPEASIAAEEVLPTRSRLYVKYRDGGPSIAKIFSVEGKPLGDIPSEPVSDIRFGARLTGDDVLVRTMSYLSPPTWLRFDARRDRLTPARLNGTPSFDFSDAKVTRVSAISKDGTRVPLNILQRKDLVLDGRNPVLLYGYGGYGVSMQPWFDPLNRLWLDYGGVFAVANVRGGGEYGEPWHKAGNLTHKQNVFDDFDACMRYLADGKYTTSARLAIMGGSNGGLTMGAVLTQHPQAMRAIVSEVGIYDALRWETQPNGEFNTTEFGSTKDPEQFRALYAFSPLLRVRDGVAYAAVLLTTGANDGRVASYESRKFAARLQAATSSSAPILLRTEAAAGHGIGTALSTQIEEHTDIYAFLIDQLRIEGPVSNAGTPPRP
jgi:prolyl oligopeptidase